MKKYFKIIFPVGILSFFLSFQAFADSTNLRDRFDYLSKHSLHEKEIETFFDSLQKTVDTSTFDWNQVFLFQFNSEYYYKVHKNVEAIALELQLLTYLEKCKEDVSEQKLTSYLCLAKYHRAVSNLHEHEKYMQKIEAGLQRTTQPSLIVKYLLERGAWFFLKEELDSAVHYFQLSYQKAIDNQLNNLATTVWLNLAGVYYLRGDLDEMGSILKEISAYTKEENGILGEGNYYNLYGAYHLAKGSYKKATFYFKKKQKLLQNGHKKTEEYLSTLYNLYISHYYDGKLDSAVIYLEKYANYKDSLELIKLNKTILEFEGKYNTEKLEKEKMQATLLAEKHDKKAKTWLVLALLGFLCLVLAVVLWVFYRKQMVSKQKIAQAELQLERKLLNETIQWHEIEKMDALLEGQAKERSRVAADLHDRVGGMLAALNFQMQYVFEYFGKADNVQDVEMEQLNKSKDLLQATFEEVRRISHNLEAENFGTISLTESIKNLSQDLNINHLIKYTAYINIKSKIPPSVSTTLYRLSQEALVNCIKYAKAKNFFVTIIEEDKELSLLIEDDGCGFEVKSNNKGMGFLNMEKRILRLGGSFTVESSPQQGTTITANIPLSPV